MRKGVGNALVVDSSYSVVRQHLVCRPTHVVSFLFFAVISSTVLREQIMSGSKKILIVLIANEVNNRNQASDQGRALGVLKARAIPHELVDGTNPDHREK